MREIVTEIDINASPSRVWQILTEFSAYPNWNPFARRIEGKLEVGSKLEVVLKPPKAKGMTFRPVVLKAKPNEEFRWLGKLGGLGFLFTGEHFFILKPTRENATRLVHGEKFTGLLTSLLWKSIDTDSRQGFIQFNEALK
ncbi:MAG: SRPBCC family protein, partial [Candidatus Bathyarchaeia archaeon]